MMTLLVLQTLEKCIDELLQEGKSVPKTDKTNARNEQVDKNHDILSHISQNLMCLKETCEPINVKLAQIIHGFVGK